VGLRRSTLGSGEKDGGQIEEEAINWEKKFQEEEEKAFSLVRARAMARPDVWYMLIGTLGAVMAGGVFPVWGILFSATIDMLFVRVDDCSDTSVPSGYSSCEEYWTETADKMQRRSYQISGFWAALCAASILGNVIVFFGFGTATERLSKRVRDSSFMALLRQEVAFFDKRSVGSITSQLQDDAARIQAFTGEPVRAFVVAMSSIVTGVVVSLVVSDVLSCGGLNLICRRSSQSSSLWLTVYVAFRIVGHRMHPCYGFRVIGASQENDGRRSWEARR
jgi:ATP-binding cassette subfamily B (MDR/TAP) protein 1